MMKVYGLVNKKRWKFGKILNEPDKVKWIDKDSDLICEILRDKHFGFLRGMVYAPLSIKDKYQKDKGKCLDIYGTALSAFAMKNEFIISFDCYLPCFSSPGQTMLLNHNKDYKDINFVIGECQKLAAQIKKYYIEGESQK